jgi:hypothetical protein
VCCGALVGQNRKNPDAGAPRRVFTLGALGGNEPQVLTQFFTARGQGAGFAWQRRPMSEDELTRMGLALARGIETVQQALGTEVVAAPPDAVLATLDDNDAALVCTEWLRDAEAELERRQQIVREELARRGL